MDYKLSDLIDVEKSRSLLESFCEAVGIASAIIDLEGNVLIGVRWQKICTDFHRVNESTCKRCIESDTKLANELKLKLSQLENAFNQALESVRTLGVSAEEYVCKLPDEEIAAIPAELAHDIAKRIRDAAEMGDFTTLSAIAEEIEDQSDSCIPLSKQIVQMAEDFDLDGAQKLADALDAC